MRTAPLLSIAAAVVLLSACGGERKHAKSAEAPVVVGDSSQADMPPPPEKTSETASADGKNATAPAETPSLAIKIAPMKITPAQKGKALEVKADGTITSGGKTVAKIAGDQVDAVDDSGTLVTVSMDGSLVGQAVKPGLKLEGNDLVGDDGTKLSMSDDGSISSERNGKSAVVAKVEGGADAKRTAVLVTALLMSAQALPAPAAPSAKKAKK